MPVYGLRFRALGQTCYYAAPAECRLGEYALIEFDQGIALAQIVSGPFERVPGADEGEPAEILRLASQEDMDIFHKNRQIGKHAAIFCKQRINERRLDMKLVDVEVFFDRSKFIFYFTAPNRIDFRDLVKDLVREFRARIELRQIGVRHEIQMLGAIGNCGQVCCCRRHLRKFAPVTIKMAKEQNLFLNPAKISGICGRLLCCLSYEQENYEQFHRESPRPGKKYQTSKGFYKVLRVNMFKNVITAVSESNEEIDFSPDDWRALRPKRQSSEQRKREDIEDKLSVYGADAETLAELEKKDFG